MTTLLIDTKDADTEKKGNTNNNTVHKLNNRGMVEW